MERQQRAAATTGEFKPITFTKTDERGDHELVAHSPSDAVKLRFDGWREKGTKASARSRGGATSTGGTTGPAAG